MLPRLKEKYIVLPEFRFVPVPRYPPSMRWVNLQILPTHHAAYLVHRRARRSLARLFQMPLNHSFLGSKGNPRCDDAVHIRSSSGPPNIHEQLAYHCSSHVAKDFALGARAKRSDRPLGSAIFHSLTTFDVLNSVSEVNFSEWRPSPSLKRTLRARLAQN